MKRFISLFLMTVAFGVTTILAQDNDGKYTLQNGDRTMVIDAAKGGKILSLKYGEREVISQRFGPVRRRNGTGPLCRSTTSGLIRWSKRMVC